MGVSQKVLFLHICVNKKRTMKQIYLLAFIFSIPFVGISQDRESDSLALVSIYQSLDGDNWPTNENWLSDMPIKEWEGINITNNRVTKLEIKSNASAGIEGEFPLQVLDLSELKTLELRYVNLNGPIPESLVQLTKLDRIIFNHCNLTGDLPQIFDQFENLRTLGLSFNELTGPLPALPQNMFLAYIDRNQFTGPILESWTGNQMTNLQIHGNQLTGNYDILTTLPNLKSMNLSDNDWDEHTLPLWIDDITNLERFSCDGCNIVGEIPTELDFSAQENYSGMFLSENNISGDISILFNNPEYGKKLFLRARSNNLSGELPVHKIVSFHELDVYNNHYSSMTNPQENVEYTLDILYNDFTYEGLNPVQKFIELDTLIGVKYWNLNATGTEDTLVINTQTSVTLLSGDNHPNTTYQWHKGNTPIEGETGTELTIEITENNQSGWYRCKMENPDYPELSLHSHRITLDIDISTSTKNTTLHNLSISPNPTDHLLKISDLNHDRFSYSIMTLDGKMIRKQQIENSKTIDVSDLDSGAYFLRISTNDEFINRKFIKI